MTAMREARERLRAAMASAGVTDGPVGAETAAAGVAFVAVGGPLEGRWRQAMTELEQCVGPLADDGEPVLSEGGVYFGSWLESTGTISAETLSRFAPGVARATFLQFADHRRDDGLLPYKVTRDGPAFSQIQMVTPLARSVWNHHRAVGGDRDLLEAMYPAMQANDAWLARHRDTLGTGGVEAFCTFDTGHDLSPRFWYAPDRSFRGDASLVDPAATAVPVVAPDLTANVASQRATLALIAAELGEDPRTWRARAQASEEALWRTCWHPDDEMFYDRDRRGAPVRVASDVLLRVWACDIGDADVFERSLERHLMNTGRFLSGYGFTSLSMDDPRFDHDFRRNSWGGPVNFLTLIRAPHAFERHGRFAELGVVAERVLGATAVADRFPQCLDPWTGAAGFTEVYSPAILWFLDAVERWSGILRRPDGDVWLSGLAPTRLEHGAAAAAVGYARTIDGVRLELAADDDDVEVYRDGAPWLRFPRGWRVILDAELTPRAVTCLAAGPVVGTLSIDADAVELALDPNETIRLDGAVATEPYGPGFVPPHAG